jgi:hypothetical protein
MMTQKRPRLKLSHQKSGSPPLLLLPLSFPSHSAYSLTPWNTINVHLPSFLPYFSLSILHSSDGNDNNHDDRERDPTQEIKSRSSNPTRSTSLTVIPGGTYSHVSYVRVYANCRLRRIWFGEGDSGQKVPWEFELYSVWRMYNNMAQILNCNESVMYMYILNIMKVLYLITLFIWILWEYCYLCRKHMGWWIGWSM